MIKKNGNTHCILYQAMNDEKKIKIQQIHFHHPFTLIPHKSCVDHRIVQQSKIKISSPCITSFSCLSQIKTYYMYKKKENPVRILFSSLHIRFLSRCTITEHIWANDR